MTEMSVGRIIFRIQFKKNNNKILKLGFQEYVITLLISELEECLVYKFVKEVIVILKRKI